MDNYSKIFNSSDVVLISEVKNNKQLTNYLLPKIYDSNYQFSNHFIYFNNNPSEEEYQPVKKILNSKKTIQFNIKKKFLNDLFLEQVSIMKNNEYYRIILKFKKPKIYRDIRGCKFFLHSHPYKQDISKLPESRILSKFDNWDFIISARNVISQDDELLIFQDFFPTLNNYESFRFGIFGACGNSKKITIKNIQLPN